MCMRDSVAQSQSVCLRLLAVPSKQPNFFMGRRQCGFDSLLLSASDWSGLMVGLPPRMFEEYIQKLYKWMCPEAMHIDVGQIPT